MLGVLRFSREEPHTILKFGFSNTFNIIDKLVSGYRLLKLCNILSRDMVHKSSVLLLPEAILLSPHLASQLCTQGN